MNILLTSVGRRSYIVRYFKELLSKFDGKVYASNNVFTYALTKADSHIITPDIYSDEYIDFLIEYCKTNQITVIVSLFDIDLPVLATNKARFMKYGITVIVSDIDVIDICNDKWKSYQFLIENKFNVPKMFISLDEAIRSISTGQLRFPLIVKPRWGMGSIAIYRADNIDELNIFYNKVFREIESSYLKYESKKNIETSVVIQEFMEAQEYGLDVFNDLSGNYVTTIAKEKLQLELGRLMSLKLLTFSPLWK